MSAQRPEQPDPILAFYGANGTDARGRTLADIWSWDHDRLEQVHDYIQWLFPLSRRSAFNPDAPVLTDETIRTFSRDDELKERLKRSFAIMLAFYGLTLRETAEAPVRVETSEDFVRRAVEWLHPGDHNHLRLSRMLESTRVLGLPAHSRALFACLDRIASQHPGSVSADTRRFWTRSARGDEDR